jgi:lysyl oxidase
MKAGRTICMVVTIAALVAPARADSVRPRPDVAVRPGRPAFWNGVYERRGSHTHVYRLEVHGRRAALRIGIDVPTRTDIYHVVVIDPSGKKQADFYKGYSFAVDERITTPEPGLWRIEVTSRRVTKSVFRMRARLEGKPRRTRRRVLPNLRAIPPFDFTFTAPQEGSGSDYDNDPNATTPGSCAPDEITEDGAVRCLRFSAGIENAGRGPLDLRFDPSDEKHRMRQWIHRANGAVASKRRAGHFEWHETHKHFHYKNIWTFELLEVTDKETGAMSVVADGRKSGFCPADQLIAEWRSFYQTEAYRYSGNCGVRYVETADGFEGKPRKHDGSMAFSPGWGDVYGWYRPGNYVDMGAAPDGLYVVRVAVDSGGHVRETTGSDNSAYALVRIDGAEIEIKERGRGTDPWDPDKVVIRDWWRRLVP